MLGGHLRTASRWSPECAPLRATLLEATLLEATLLEATLLEGRARSCT